MSNKKENRKAAEQLNAYIDRPELGREELPPADAALVDALQRAAAGTRPRPGFVNELAQELSAREDAMPEQPEGRPLILRLLAGGATLVAAVVLIVVIAGLFARRPNEPALEDVDITPPNQIDFIGTAQGGFLAGMEIQVVDAPSAEPAQLAGYTFQPGAQPQTPEEARVIAARFGLGDARIYHPSLGSGLTAFAADGRSLTLADSHTGFGFYYGDPTVASDGDDAPPFGEAAAAADAFLQPTGFLPAAYELQPVDEANQAGVTGVRVVPLLDGFPVVGNESTVIVNGAGEIVSAFVIPFAAAPTGETVDAGSARDALQSLLAGPEAYSYSYNALSTAGSPRVFAPPPPEGESGDTVTVTGWPVVYTDAENGQQLVQLSALSGVQYVVEGLELDGIESRPGLVITGTLGEQLGPRSWRLSADTFALHSGDARFDCRTGRLERLADGAYLVLDDGEGRYLVPNAPEALEDGARIELCAKEFEADKPLSWMHIASPPSTELPEGALGSGGSVRSVTAVELEPTVTAPEAVEPAEPGTATDVVPPGVTESVSAVTQQTRPVAIESPYAIGESVDVTGRVNGVIWSEAEGRRYEIFLTIDTDGDLTTYPVILQLQGEPELLEEIAGHYFLHVAVQGTVVENEAGGQALQVESFERVWPEEELQAFLGHKSVETVEGREVTIFTDEATGERFVIYLQPVPPSPEEDGERRILVTGAIHPEATFGGLRLLETAGELSGGLVDRMESADERPIERNMPVHEVISGVSMGGGGTLIVERIVLGYEMTPSGSSPEIRDFTLIPAWLFYGRDAEGTVRFTVRLPLDGMAGEGSAPGSTLLSPTRVQNEQSYPAPPPVDAYPSP